MTKTYYVWDEENDSLLEEIDENGNVIVSYTNEPGPFGKVILQERDGVTSYYHYDGQGSTVALTDDNENVTDTYVYSAFGELVSSTGTTVNPFRYVGQYGYYTDVETNDIYIRARSYNPSLGRWLTRDPIGFRGSPWDLYEYVESNPLNVIDPSGLLYVPPPPLVGTPHVLVFTGGVAVGYTVSVPFWHWVYGPTIYNPKLVPKPLPRPKPGPRIPYFPPNTNCPPKNSDKRDECLDDCDKVYEEDGEQCRNLRDPGGRARCWAQLAEELARCIKNCPE